MDAGRELDSLVARRVMGKEMAPDTSGYVWNEYQGWVLPQPYSTDIAAAWQVVEHLHENLSPAEMGYYSYLALTCTGHYGANWCASFDFNLDDEWFESAEALPFGARGTTPAEAICRAAISCGI